MARVPAVLVVDQDPEARFQVRRLLEQVAFDCAGEAAPGTEALARAAELRPDVIVCGLREPVSRALQTIEALVHALPQTPLIAHSTSTDLDLVRRAMLAGARDFISTPAKPAELDRSLAAALESEERRRMREAGASMAAAFGRVITVFGAKGGTGKTALASNLAVALALAGQSAVLVDLDDTFGDAAATLAVERAGSVTDALRQVDDEDDAAIKHLLSEHRSGLAVLAAPSSPFAWRDASGGAVRRLLERLGRQFDIVLVDTGSHLSDVTLAALEAASQVLWVTSPEFSSVHDTLEAFDALRAHGINDDKIAVVINHPSPEIEVRRDSLEQALGRRVFWTVPNDRRLRQCAQSGEALVERGAGSPAAAALHELAATLGGAPAAAPPGPGLLGRLFGARQGAPALREKEALS